MVHTRSTSEAASRSARKKTEAVTSFLTAFVVAAATVVSPPSAHAQLRESAAKLIARTIGNPELRPKFCRGAAWLGNRDAYLDLEPTASGAGNDIIKYDNA